MLKKSLEFSPWYHDTSLFLFGGGYKKGEMEKLIQLGIEPLPGKEEAIFSIFVTVFSGDRMRFKGWWVAKGILGRDQDRLEEWLEVAHSIFGHKRRGYYYLIDCSYVG